MEAWYCHVFSLISTLIRRASPGQLLMGGFNSLQAGNVMAIYALFFILGIAAWTLLFPHAKRLTVMFVGTRQIARGIIRLKENEPAASVRVCVQQGRLAHDIGIDLDHLPGEGGLQRADVLARFHRPEWLTLYNGPAGRLEPDGAHCPG